ncbi:FAD-binding protein [Streptomyces sp. NPDC006365]|uniref:FAD-binding protein n=1 Tax=Streptomyces sp. NPDC006365 TaxID=3364744 RepID=UPI00369B75CC
MVAVLRACRERGLPVTAPGGGTSMAGNAVGPSVVLDCFWYMKRVLDIDAEARGGWNQPARGTGRPRRTYRRRSRPTGGSLQTSSSCSWPTPASSPPPATPPPTPGAASSATCSAPTPPRHRNPTSARGPHPHRPLPRHDPTHTNRPGHRPGRLTHMTSPPNRRRLLTTGAGAALGLGASAATPSPATVPRPAQRRRR